MNARTSYGPSSSVLEASTSDVRPISHINEIARSQPAPPSPLDAAQWLIHVEGGEVVGPVSANQVARGMRAGRVPSDASIQAVGEVFWTGLLDEPAIIAALKSI